MPVALMTDPYGRVRQNFVAVDSKERLVMIHEISSVRIKLIGLIKMLRGRRRSCMYQVINPEEAELLPQNYFLLVVREFEMQDNSVMAIERSIEEMNRNISSIAQTITGQVGKTIKGEIRTVKDSVKDESLRVINYGIKRDIQAIKGEVQAIKLDLLTVKQSVKDEI